MALIMGRRSVGGRPRLLGWGSLGLTKAHWAAGRQVSQAAIFSAANSAARKLGTRRPAAQVQSFLPVFFAAPQVFAKAQVVLHPRPIFQTGSEEFFWEICRLFTAKVFAFFATS